VVNNSSNVIHAPGGSVVNNNYNQTALFLQDAFSDAVLFIEKGA